MTRSSDTVWISGLPILHGAIIIVGDEITLLVIEEHLMIIIDAYEANHDWAGCHADKTVKHSRIFGVHELFS